MLSKFNREKRLKLDHISDMELWETVTRFNESVSLNVSVAVIVKNLVMKLSKQRNHGNSFDSKRSPLLSINV